MAAAASGKRRDPWLDNVKMVLVTLVVIGHSWGLLEGTPATHWVYDFLYYWHIPAFVLVSGYLSRSFEWDRPHLRSLVLTILIPYLLFEPALYFFRQALGQHESGLLWVHPHWAMWYLIVLFFWRLGTPILKRHWVWVPIAVAISLVAGLVSGQVFYTSRILGLLPFFVLGLHLTPRRMARLDDPWVRLTAVGALVGIFVLARNTDAWTRTAFLWYDAGYDDLGLRPEIAVPTRLAIMGLGFVGAFSVLALTPRMGGWFARMGSATLIIYLFHGFPIRFGEWLGVKGWTEGRAVPSMLVITLAAIGLSLLLGSPPARRWLVWAVNPIGTWQQRRAARQSSVGGPQDASTAERGTESSTDASRLSGA